jgi:hypothetical protein
MPLILTSQEAEIRSQHVEIILETLEKRAGGVAQGVGFEFIPQYQKRSLLYFCKSGKHCPHFPYEEEVCVFTLVPIHVFGFLFYTNDIIVTTGNIMTPQCFHVAEMEVSVHVLE